MQQFIMDMIQRWTAIRRNIYNCPPPKSIALRLNNWELAYTRLQVHICAWYSYITFGNL
jgi:hypothetical protein